MNAYDFDNTIFRGDSTARFYLYCLRRRPRIALRGAQILVNGARYVAGRLDRTGFKQYIFRFLRDVDDVPGAVRAFWDEEEARVKAFYLRVRRSDDVVISASPEFLLEPICERLGVGTLIASRVDPRTGLYAGHNCGGEEKVRRFHEVFPGARPEAFYSDSLVDAPMARLAERAYFVRGERVGPWPSR